MFFRRAWQRVGPLARWLRRPLSKSTPPLRHMAFGVPGGSSNMAYVVLCGGGLTAAVVYAYKTVNGDTERYEDRLANMSSKEKAEVTSETASSAVDPSTAKEEPASGAEITAQSVATSPEPEAEPTAEAISEDPVAAETSEVAVTDAELTAEAASEEPAAAEMSEVAVTEAEPADAEEADPAAEEETAPEAAPEVAAVPPAEDAEAESAAVKALATSTLEIINAFVGDDSLMNTLHQMETDGNQPNSFMEVLEPEALEAISEVATTETSGEAAVVREEEKWADVEEVTHGLTIEELSAEEEEERESSLPEEIPEAEGIFMMPDSSPNETLSPSEEDLSSCDESSHIEEVIINAGATPEEEETQSEEITPGTVGETTQLAAASTEANLEALSATEQQASSPAVLKAEKEPCHNCHTSSLSNEAAPPAALGEDVPDTDIPLEDRSPHH